MEKLSRILFSKDQNKNSLVLFMIVFFLLLCFSLRGFFGTMSLIAIRSGLSDQAVLTALLRLQAPITSFEYIMLSLNFLIVAVTLVVLPLVCWRLANR